jgi:hypothetical protein
MMKIIHPMNKKSLFFFARSLLKKEKIKLYVCVCLEKVILDNKHAGESKY